MNNKLKSDPDWLELAKQANWSIADAARLCGLSVRTLERYFQKKMKITPRKWFAEQRQKLALELLEGGTSVKETASQLGYQHAQHFSRQFRKNCGCSPSMRQTPVEMQDCRNWV